MNFDTLRGPRLPIPDLTPTYQLAFQSLVKEVEGFERGLSSDREVGISVSGTENVIHIRAIRHSGQMIVFEGIDTQGRDACLIQHYTQVHVQMVAADKIGEEAKRIGFHRPI